MTRSYEDLIAAKAHAPTFAGIETDNIAGHLFPHQRDLTRWALRRGRAAVFADTGMGKGLIAAEWARHVAAHGRVIILAPLAVGPQLSREAARFGVEAPYVRSDTGAPIVITNYALLGAFLLALLDGGEALRLRHLDGEADAQIGDGRGRDDGGIAPRALATRHSELEYRVAARFGEAGVELIEAERARP